MNAATKDGGAKRAPEGRRFEATIRYEPMHRDSVYVIYAIDNLTANLRALKIAGELGEQYTVRKCVEVDRGR